ncbi:MAG: enoyl-CoA hydratase-related protein, partial [Pseudomonadota bacterium]
AHANRAFTDTFAALYAMPKPVVAAVGGAAIAGGFFFAAAADWTVATDAARFGLAEVAVGAPLPLGPLEIARAELTPAAFRRLLLTGTPISAEEAAAAGLVDEFAEPDTLAKTAFDRAKALAAHLPAAYAATKADLRRPTLDRIAAGREASLAAWFVDGTRDRMRARLA